MRLSNCEWRSIVDVPSPFGYDSDHPLRRQASHASHVILPPPLARPEYSRRRQMGASGYIHHDRTPSLSNDQICISLNSTCSSPHRWNPRFQDCETMPLRFIRVPRVNTRDVLHLATSAAALTRELSSMSCFPPAVAAVSIVLLIFETIQVSSYLYSHNL